MDLRTHVRDDNRAKANLVIDIVLERIFRASAPFPLSLFELLGTENLHFRGQTVMAESKVNRESRMLEVAVTILDNGIPVRLTYRLPEAIVEHLRLSYLQHVAGRLTAQRSLDF